MLKSDSRHDPELRGRVGRRRGRGGGAPPAAATATATDAKLLPPYAPLRQSRSDLCGAAADGSSPRPRSDDRGPPTSDAGCYLFSKRGARELFLIKRQSGGGEDQSLAAAIRLPLPLECQGV